MSQKSEKLRRRVESLEDWQGFNFTLLDDRIQYLERRMTETDRRRRKERDARYRVNARLTIIALILAAAVGLTLLVRAMPVAAELDKPAGAAVRTIPEASGTPENFENAKIEQALYESGYFRADIPLDGDTQAFLRAACEESGVSYELALAVIWKETGYRNVVGDDGESTGYMQIQRKWHEGRMARLGVADLSDPCGNFRVGCDYLAELLEKYSLPDALTAYNSGAPGKSDYAAAVIGYLGALEGEELQ